MSVSELLITLLVATVSSAGFSVFGVSESIVGSLSRPMFGVQRSTYVTPDGRSGVEVVYKSPDFIISYATGPEMLDRSYTYFVPVRAFVASSTE